MAVRMQIGYQGSGMARQEMSKKKKVRVLTPQDVHDLLQTHLAEILEQLGDWQEMEVGVPVGDPEPHLLVRVRPEQVSSMPPVITVHTALGAVEIPLKISGDYAAYRVLSS